MSESKQEQERAQNLVEAAQDALERLEAIAATRRDALDDDVIAPLRNALRGFPRRAPRGDALATEVHLVADGIESAMGDDRDAMRWAKRLRAALRRYREGGSK